MKELIGKKFIPREVNKRLTEVHLGEKDRDYGKLVKIESTKLVGNKRFIAVNDEYVITFPIAKQILRHPINKLK